MPPERDLLQLLHDIRGRLDGNVSLQALAMRAGWSPFHLHRAFRRVIGETPKQYTLRLRLERAAAQLASSRNAVFNIAVDAAVERWIEANGWRAGGPPWESYITDPADFPDPSDWRTEVYWPLAQ